MFQVLQVHEKMFWLYGLHFSDFREKSSLSRSQIMWSYLLNTSSMNTVRGILEAHPKPLCKKEVTKNYVQVYNLWTVVSCLAMAKCTMSANMYLTKTVFEWAILLAKIRWAYQKVCLEHLFCFFCELWVPTAGYPLMYGKM